MSGAALSPAPQGPSGPGAAGEDDLFASALVASNPPKRAGWWGAQVSVVVHIVTLSCLIFIPIFWQEPPPEQGDMIRALLYDPPPPPPPPLNRGSSLARKTEVAKPVTPDPEVKVEPKFVAPIEQPRPEEKPLTPEQKTPEADQFGSETGSDSGVPDGMDVGVEGGQVGGVPGGVLGGVVGGTGNGPVMDYDQAPRPIKQNRPQYPTEAFVKKIEGTVVVEILIDVNGRVVRTRVLQSVPLLDAAAVQCVYQWVFSPAMKHGRPVATIVHAPVTFRIY